MDSITFVILNDEDNLVITSIGLHRLHVIHSKPMEGQRPEFRGFYLSQTPPPWGITLEASESASETFTNPSMTLSSSSQSCQDVVSLPSSVPMGASPVERDLSNWLAVGDSHRETHQQVSWSHKRLST